MGTWKRMAAMGIIVCIALAQAGTSFELTCSNETCAFKGILRVGGGMTYGQIQGYCMHCAQGVTINWAREKDAKPPKPLAEFWDPMAGKVRRVYECPKCGKPFVAIDKIEDFRYCPKCGKPTLGHKRSLFYD